MQRFEPAKTDCPPHVHHSDSPKARIQGLRKTASQAWASQGIVVHKAIQCDHGFSSVVEMGHSDPRDLGRERSISACSRSQSITEVNEGKSPGPGRKEPRRDVVGAHGLFVWITHRQIQFVFLSIAGSPVQAGLSYMDHKPRQPFTHRLI